MNDVRADLRSYYEAEAKQRLRKPLRGRRLELRAEYLALLAAEARHSVVDFGAGPGGDGQAFLDAGHSFVGLDLAHGNGVLAAESGLTVIQGSIGAPPLRPASFDAGWSMSTLMHIPEPEVPAVLAEMVHPLRPGAPLCVAQWGAQAGRASIQEVDENDRVGQRRLFSLRTLETNRELLSAVGHIEQETVWPIDTDGWEYHIFVVRLPGEAAA